MAETLNTDLLFRMIAHWLATKPNSYYGSSYGAPLEELLQKPLNSPMSDAFLAKMREDIPVLAALPGEAVNLWASTEGVDRKNLHIEILGRYVSLDDLLEVSSGNN